MSDLRIEVDRRSDKGKNENRRLRAGGYVPAVVYGAGRETVPIRVHKKSLVELLKKGGDNPIFLLKLAETGQERHAMIRELQVDPISREVLHVDFQRVLMTEKVRVKVPVELSGTAHGVKNEGGLLDFVHREVEVECLPADIPRAIELDVTNLHVGQHVEARELALPAGVTLLDVPEQVIVSLGHARVEAEPVAAEGLVEAAEPEVIKRGKAEEEES